MTNPLYAPARLGLSACGALFLLSSLPATAAKIEYYTPPKLVKRAPLALPIAGSGSVIVQVQVFADGSFKVTHVIRSTNHGDDEAALDIARRSVYKPATRGKTRLTAFYDYTLKFVGKSVVGPGETGNSLAAFSRMLHAGNYAGAKTGVTAYLAAHAGNQAAYAILGTADAFLSDWAGAVSAFDKAGTLAPGYRNLAATAYASYGASILSTDPAGALAAARKAVALNAGTVSFNALGTAEFASKDFASAVADFERARQMEPGNMPLKARMTIDTNLVNAYLATGQLDKAKALVAHDLQLDPSNRAPEQALAAYYLTQAKQLETAGKAAAAVAMYEAGALGVPSMAVTMYARAALENLGATPGANPSSAKADVDKALALDPNNADANFAAGVYYAKTGKRDDAMTYLKKAQAEAQAANETTLLAAIENFMGTLKK